MDAETNDKICSFFTGKPYKGKYLWLNFFVFGTCHLFALLGAYFLFTKASFYTWLACIFFYNWSFFGVTVGGHRFYAHRSFKANVYLRTLLMLMHTTAYQRDMIKWVRWHRCHHKWMDTNADPHGVHRGFFFAHMGWLLMRPHPEHLEKRKLIDMSDCENDPVLQFQAKHYNWLAPLCASIGPATLAVVGWGEDPLVAISSAFARWIFSLHMTWTINSVSHIIGMKPFNSKISPAENLFAKIAIFGEGYHNFHHTFPVDYRSSELGFVWSPATFFIDFFAWLGWATDLKTVCPKKVAKRKLENMKISDTY